MSAVGIGFVVYLVIILIVGFLSARLTRTLPDFLLAGRKLCHSSGMAVRS